MADAVDDDTKRAVVSLWQGATTLNTISIEQGRLKSPQTQSYAEVTCKLDAREMAATGGAWFDKRRVEIIIRGQKPDVITAIQNARAVFKHGIFLTYPSGARCMGWVPDKDSGEEMDDSSKEGRDVWKGTISAFVESVRLF